MDNSRPSCKECSRPATHIVRDIKANIENGQTIKRPFGDKHYYCEEHKREAMIFYDGPRYLGQ